MKAIFGVTASFLTAAGAQAASLQGEAMVSRGEGYKAQVGGQLHYGDMVMVRKDSSAIIAFDDGCSFTLSSGRIFTVGGKSPCATGAQATRTIDFSGRMGQSGDVPNELPAEQPGLLSNPAVVIGGVAVIAGAGALVYYATKDDKKSSSP